MCLHPQDHDFESSNTLKCVLKPAEDFFFNSLTAVFQMIFTYFKDLNTTPVIGQCFKAELLILIQSVF